MIMTWFYPSVEGASESSSGRLTPLPLTGHSGSDEGFNVKRRRRTVIKEEAKALLEKCYTVNKFPSGAEYEMMANSIGMDKEAVRNWFCNRRAKDKE